MFAADTNVWISDRLCDSPSYTSTDGCVGNQVVLKRDETDEVSSAVFYSHRPLSGEGAHRRTVSLRYMCPPPSPTSPPIWHRRSCDFEGRIELFIGHCMTHFVYFCIKPIGFRRQEMK